MGPQPNPPNHKKRIKRLGWLGIGQGRIVRLAHPSPAAATTACPAAVSQMHAGPMRGYTSTAPSATKQNLSELRPTFHAFGSGRRDPARHCPRRSGLNLQIECVCGCNSAHGLQLFRAIQSDDCLRKSLQIGFEFLWQLYDLPRLWFSKSLNHS